MCWHVIQWQHTFIYVYCQKGQTAHYFYVLHSVYFTIMWIANFSRQNLFYQRCKMHSKALIYMMWFGPFKNCFFEMLLWLNVHIQVWWAPSLNLLHVFKLKKFELFHIIKWKQNDSDPNKLIFKKELLTGQEY